MSSTMARLRVQFFLSGLNSEFYQVRGEILRKDPKLDLESPSAYVRCEHQQRKTMGGGLPISESTVLITKPPSSVRNHKSQQSEKSNNFTCDHSSETGHSIQKCYEAYRLFRLVEFF